MDKLSGLHANTKKNYLSIEGKKFNRLTVIDVDLGMTKKKKRLYVVAKCDCGVVKSYGANDLKNGRILSCGCLKKERHSEKRSKVGDHKNRLTVLEAIPEDGKPTKVRCKCDCGNETIMLENSFKTGGTKSCGCLNIEKIKERHSEKRSKVGDHKNRLTVLEVITEDNKQTKVRCKCDCGNAIVTSDSSFKNGCTKSCGCLKTEKHNEYHKQTTDSLVKVGQVFGNHRVLTQLEERSKRGDIQWEVINLNTGRITIKSTGELTSWEIRRIRDVVRNAFRRTSEIKGKRTLQLLNCTDEDIKDFIAQKPNDGQLYHLDHICPIHQATGLDELEKLQDLRNFQLLSKDDNLAKSDKKTPEGEEMCKLLLGRDWID